MSELDEVDVAVLARRSSGTWRLDELPDRALASASALVTEVDRHTAGTTLALVSVGEDFAVLVRGAGGGFAARLVLSDASAALEWDLAASVLDLLGLEAPDDDAEPEPAGDLALLRDHDLTAADLTALVADEDHPDDLLAAVADELGFGDELDDLLESDDEADDEADDDAGELEDDDLLDDLDDDPFDADADDELAEDRPVGAGGVGGVGGVGGAAPDPGDDEE